METNIVTKFAIASEEGLETIKNLTRTIAREKFTHLLTAADLEHFIAQAFSDKKLIDDLNEMLTTQWLVVYKDDTPAGYARITSKGAYPLSEQKNYIRMADFGILATYNEPLVLQSLFDKCYNLCKSYQAIWLHEYKDNPLLPFFAQNGFTPVHAEPACYDLLPIPSVFMIREKGNVQLPKG
jgi:hypothetical protein